MEINNIKDEEDEKENEKEKNNNNNPPPKDCINNSKEKIINNCNSNNNEQNVINQNYLNQMRNEENCDLDLENIDEDLYMQELYLRLSQMKQERKEAENNVKLLDNRLNLLKGEEKKAWKKIESTKILANNKLQHLQNIVQI